jgi:hypothetical protein
MQDSLACCFSRTKCMYAPNPFAGGLFSGFLERHYYETHGYYLPRASKKRPFALNHMVHRISSSALGNSHAP